MKDLVIVKSKTINNESVPVVINVIDPGTGEAEKREITRSVTFIDFQSEMPLKWAKYLIDTFPNEYVIVDGKGELSKRAKKVVKVAKEKIIGFKCEFCGTESKTKAGLTAHIRFNHPDKWEGKKTIKNKK
jgi:hypothetical protein